MVTHKILWYSLFSLHDTTNGAAIRCKLMLEKLRDRGVDVKVINTLVVDDNRGLAFFENLEKQLPEEQKNKNYYQFTDHGIEYFVIKSKAHDEFSITRRELDEVYIIYSSLLEIYQPDLVMGYGADFFSSAMRHEAHARGMSVVYALCNGLHGGYNFPDCDLVFTTSKATAKLYRERDGVAVKSVGNFIEPGKVIAQKREPQYITMINPTPQKGIAVFVKLAQTFAKTHPELKFLVVKSVGNYAAIVHSLHYADGTRLFPEGEITVDPLANISVAEHTNDIRQVYALTKVLVAPSLWHESWGRVASEAVMNGIPVLCSDSGGLPEAMAGGGIVLPAPEETVKDKLRIPTDEEIKPWAEALERLLNEDWSAQCAEAARINDINTSVDHLMALLNPLLRRGLIRKNPKNSWYSTRMSINNKYTARKA